MIRVLLTAVLIPVMLGGCAWFGDKDNAEPPAKLKSFEPQVELRSVWRRDTGAGTDELFLNLRPAVVDQQVFAADRNGSVYAYGLEKGKQLWRSKTHAAISAGPGVGEGLVLVGTSSAEVIALDAESGEERWRATVSSEVLSIPQIADGVVLVQAGDGGVTGLDVQSGELLWIHDRDVPVLSLRGASSPLVVGADASLLGFSSGKIVALETGAGRQLWETAIALPRGRSELQRIVDIDADPVIRDGVLYAASFQGQASALDLQSGRALWTREMSVYAGLAVDAQQVYISDEASELWALDRMTGATLWKQSDLRRRSVTGPALIGGFVAVGDYEGYVHLFSRFDGSLVGRERVDRDGIQAAPVALGDRLLVAGAGGKLTLYRLDIDDQE